MIAFGIEHPDKRIEGEELSFLFCGGMTVQRFDAFIDHIIRHRRNQYGEKHERNCFE